MTYTTENTKKSQEPRRKFTPEEDELLKNLVQSYVGKVKWSQIAKLIPNRNAKQCRDRYNSYLCPGLTNKEWTHEEDQLLIQKLIQFGTHWKQISAYFPDRGSNNIKNRWYKFLSKKYPGLLTVSSPELQSQPLQVQNNSQDVEIFDFDTFYADELNMEYIDDGTISNTWSF